MAHFSGMLVARRFCTLLVVLALALGTLASASKTGGMAEMGMTAMAMSQDVTPSSPDGCPDCADPARMAVCAQMVCGIFAAILPRGDLPPTPAAARFTIAPDESGTGLAGFPETPPPRRP